MGGFKNLDLILRNKAQGYGPDEDEIDATDAAALLGGEIDGPFIRCPSLGCDPDDRSMFVKLNGDDIYIYECEGPLDKAYAFVRKRLELLERPKRDYTEAISRILSETKPAESTLVTRYLGNRALTLPPPPALKFHSLLKHTPTGRWFPAMVAERRDVHGYLVAIHRNFLAHNGSGKADEEPTRMDLGSAKGSAIRLAPVSDELMIGEGIETTLSVMQETGKPAWAAGSAKMLRLLQLPLEVRRVMILADGDDPGEAAARAAAVRWLREGREVRIARAPKDKDEMDKRLTAAAISAVPIVNLNNLTEDLKSALLCQIITDKLVSLRLFHTNNRLLLCDCRMMTVFANGNGVTVVGDLVRRSLIIAMDANMEKPETRTFDFYPIDVVEDNRREYLTAIFTIVRAHIAAGCPVPKGATHNADFVQWSRFVQHPLMWLGMDDPLKSMEDARKNDPERAELSGRIQALVEAFGVGVEFTAGDVEKQMYADTHDMSGKPRPMHPELISTFSSTRGKVSSKTIGMQLAKDVKRPQGGHRLTSTHDPIRNAKVYKIEGLGPKTETENGKTEAEEPF